MEGEAAGIDELIHVVHPDMGVFCHRGGVTARTEHSRMYSYLVSFLHLASQTIAVDSGVEYLQLITWKTG